MVGIMGGQKPQVDLFRFFWRELELLGARVYEPEDYEKAIELIVSGSIDCETLITDIQELKDITKAFQACGIHDYRRDWTKITAERADGPIARHLHITEGALLVVTRALNRSISGMAVEYSRTCHCADRVELLLQEDAS